MSAAKTNILTKAPAQTKSRELPRPTEPVYVITTEGLQVLIGKNGDDIRAKIKEKGNPPDYFFYDDEKHTWVPWAMLDDGGTVKPLKFLDPEKYGVTSAELYAKTVTYPTILAQVIEIITRKAPSLWDKLMKPTTVIGAIVLIVLIMIVGVVALQG
jgi:hypothetical protein